MAARHKIVVYFDVVSPWSRVAVVALRRYQKPWNLDLIFEPVNLGYVMKQAENRPPISVQNKGIWMDEDMSRASKFYGVTLNRPPVFPVNTFFAQSLLRLIQINHPEKLDDSIDALYEAVWTRNDEVEKPETLGKVIKPIFNDDQKIKSLVERAYDKQEKGALADLSRKLVTEGGAFGAPWIVVTRKSDGKTAKFFGSDRTEQIAAFLGEPYRGPFANDSVPKL
ncbi:thioredoxin-like protein [Meira miltonrushii]|uniref:Glutathione S-transferase kappa n=1 Tax=Meira miltonrushii TaxID=1280837 RepID=A0A316VLU2_9BASI|nr:thioredoxin-like protein [Meira miltonrushii]PWN37071.1 thioredoxin-like protein [Meira miltonrushii]